MTNNEFLRSLRYALKINDTKIVSIFKLVEYEITQPGVTALLRKEEEEGFVECSDTVLDSFLNGFIISKRGKKESTPGQAQNVTPRLTNNMKLKKIRIALELQEDAMLQILKLADVVISKPELTALFRNSSHKHYKECGNQFLRNFLKGLALYSKA